MNPAAILSLLQITAAMLTTAQGGAMPAANVQSIITISQHSIQLAAQSEANIPFTVTPNNSMYPNINDLDSAAYRDTNGNWVTLGPSVILSGGDTSFGDLNNDGIDDAAVVVNKPDAEGNPHYFLDAMLNQGGVMFDIAELPLGTTDNITTHRIVSGTIMLNNSSYTLFGDALEAQ